MTNSYLSTQKNAIFHESPPLPSQRRSLRRYDHGLASRSGGRYTGRPPGCGVSGLPPGDHPAAEEEHHGLPGGGDLGPKVSIPGRGRIHSPGLQPERKVPGRCPARPAHSGRGGGQGAWQLSRAGPLPRGGGSGRPGRHCWSLRRPGQPEGGAGPLPARLRGGGINSIGTRPYARSRPGCPGDPAGSPYPLAGRPGG